jgi:hypothetical protein
MPFGKYRGTPIDRVPESYLRWCIANCSNLSLYLRMEIERYLSLTSQPQQPATAMVDPTMVDSWYRKLAREFHPDLGGSHDAMKAVNRGREVLLELAGVAQ